MGLCASAEVGHDEPARLLLLGPSGAGKSTLFNQIRLRFTQGFTPEEYEQGVRAVRNLLLFTLRMLVRDADIQLAIAADELAGTVMAQEDGTPGEVNITKAGQLLTKSGGFRGVSVSGALAKTGGSPVKECEKALNKLFDATTPEGCATLLNIVQTYWRGEHVKKALVGVACSGESSKVLGGSEWTQYWIDECDRVLVPGYAPTTEDMLKLRRPTNAKQEVAFTMKGGVTGARGAPDLDFVLIDMGGQSHEPVCYTCVKTLHAWPLFANRPPVPGFSFPRAIFLPAHHPQDPRMGGGASTPGGVRRRFHYERGRLQQKGGVQRLQPACGGARPAQHVPGTDAGDARPAAGRHAEQSGPLRGAARAQ